MHCSDFISYIVKYFFSDLKYYFANFVSLLLGVPDISPAWREDFLKLIYLLAALGLGCCAQAFFSCDEEGLLYWRCTGLSLRCPLLLWSMVSRYTGPVDVVQEPSCSAVCGIFLNQEGIHQRILVTTLLTTVLVECMKMSALPVLMLEEKC